MRRSLPGVLVAVLLFLGCGDSPIAPTLSDEAQVAQLATQFLTDFSDSSREPGYVLRNFWPACDGRTSEGGEIVWNRANRVIEEARIGEATITVAPRTLCTLRPGRGDACAYLPVEWRSLITGPAGDAHLGQVEYVGGTAQLAAVHESGRWWLCDSQWIGNALGYGPQ